MALGIDYRELLPKHTDIRMTLGKSMGDDPQMQERLVEIRRKRRIIQVAVKIS